MFIKFLLHKAKYLGGQNNLHLFSIVELKEKEEYLLSEHLLVFCFNSLHGFGEASWSFSASFSFLESEDKELFFFFLHSDVLKL